MLLRRAIYLYILLILFEGVLRKWVFPSLATPIMVLKIGLSALIVLMGARYWSKFSLWEKSFSFVGFCVLITSLVFGHGNIGIALWGCFPYWLGLNVCFIIGQAFTRKDLLNVIKLIVYTSIVNFIVLIIQFNSPTTSWINYTGTEVSDHVAETAVGDLSGGFRPCGIFYHSTHDNLFMLLSISLVLYCLVNKARIVPRYIAIGAFVLSVFASFCTSSRTCIFYFVGLVVYFLIFCVRKKTLTTFGKYLVPAAICMIPLSRMSFVDKAITNLQNRFENASETQYSGQTTMEGTASDLYYRMIAYNLNALFDPHTLDGESVPFWGFGQGLSTQVGGQLANVQKHAGFALAEFDGLRIMCESGFLFGWIILYIRLGYSWRFIPKLVAYRRHGESLTLLFFPAFLIGFFLLNTWGNAFLGSFAFMSGGLFLSSLRNKL